MAVAMIGLMGVFATSAFAFPTKTVACTGCHSGPNVAVTATLASTSGANATYDFSAPGASAVVVFDGATKLFTFLTPSGQFTVAAGKTYTLYAVTGPTTGDGIGTTTVSPVVAPPADTTAPSTASDAKATYVGSAAITLTATDAGSGVASTYYIVDGGSQTAGTSILVTTLGAHTIEFWSVDVAGNVETHNTASFTITAPVPADTTAPSTVSDAKATYVTNAVITLTATDAGSGVASTYYTVDGGSQTAGTSILVTTLGAHTIEFWSVDVAGNIEAHHTASFTITAAPAPVPSPGAFTVRLRVSGDHNNGRTATLTSTTTGATFTGVIGREGAVTFVDVPAGTYTLSVATSDGVRTVRTVTVGASHHDSEGSHLETDYHHQLRD
jgi:hypothetical protein